MATPVSQRMEEHHERAYSKWHEYRYGMLYGLLPLAAVAVIIVAALLLAALERQLIGVSSFLLQQQVVLLTLGGGVILALVAFTLALIFTLRYMTKWEHDRQNERVHAALWTLAVSALVILLPTLLAFVLP